MEMTGGNSMVARTAAEFKTGKWDRNRKIGSGGWIRTNDLRVVGPTNFHC